MSISQTNGAGLAQNPLGAGDLIDRSVRFYRKNFWTFILIAAPPVVAGILFSVGWMVLGRNLFNVTTADPAESIFYQLFLRLGDLIIWVIQLVAMAVVMGGASRNFVRHILFGESMSFRETYRNARSRLAGLAGVSLLLTLSLGFLGILIFYISILVAVIAIGLAVFVLESIPFLAIVISTILSVAAIGGGVFLFFLVSSRFIYVPQVMLVEGAGAFSAIGRSVSLAGKNVKRVAALSIFTVVAIYSALSLVYVPLSLFAYFSGVPLFSFDAVDTLPAWFEITSQVIFQGSLILIIPVLMIGLCLLYVDERTRSEGYDIELLAVTHLGEMPSVPPEFVNPLQPALAEEGVISQASPRPPVRERPKGPLGLE
ncbi:MAG: hypothetical protein IPM63_15910 [Acidobacteriota bacterium]|nr:MAG: hypothetical protein IPM63_15910 [Acidobacteriota bacterium]